MATASQSRKSTVLNSWKEVAAYLGRGVRTVQRYERDLGLPVRRPRGTARSAVIALTDELDAWLHHAPTHESSDEPRPPLARPDNGPKLEPAVVLGSVRQSITEGAELRDRCTALRDAHAQAVVRLVTNLSGLVEVISTSSPVKKSAESPTLSEGD